MKCVFARIYWMGLALSAAGAWTEAAWAQPSAIGQWSSVMSWGQFGGVEAIHTHLLPTGKVLFWSGWEASIGLWDPMTNQFSAAAVPSFNIFCSGHTFLADGRLMVVGGHISNYNGENRADIYDPWTNTWANSNPGVPDVPTMGPTTSNQATSGKRWYPSATTLGNGDVLVLSGDVVSQGVTNRRVQVYEVATNTWRELMGALRPSGDLLPEYPRVFLAPDGRAISLSDNSNDTEFLNLSGNGSWTYLQDTLDSNLHNYGPAVMYDSGKIAYIGGGHNPTRNISMLDLNVANPSWSYGADDMAQPRRQNNATILADGTVLITGGTSVTGWNDPNGLIATAELWDPDTEQVTQMTAANVNIYRGYHSTALLLPDGRVLVTGGDHDYGGAIPGQNTNAEIYSPAYLFKGARPTVTAAPDDVDVGDTFFVQTPDAADIVDVNFVAPGSVTHAHDWSQRNSHLEFEVVSGGINVTLPSNPNVVPPGYYMLFLINSNGVPSMAEWVRAEIGQPSDGDLNDDGFVNTQDIDILWNVIRPELAGDDDPGANDDEDLNGDGFVNEDDVDYMLANLLDAGTNRQYGDADLDGGVGGLDFTAWRLRAGTGWANGDFDGDGGVGGLDFTLWRTRPSQYPDEVGPHSGGGITAVPEPGTLILTVLGIVPAILGVRRQRSRPARG